MTLLIPHYRTARRASGAPAVGDISFIGSNSNTSDLTTYTYSSEPIGTAASDRHVIVAVHARGTVGATLSSATIGGVSAAIATQISASGNIVAIIIAAVPTGTTADVVVTFSAGVSRSGIGVYRATGISATAFDTGTDAAIVPSIAIDVEADGVIVTAYTSTSTAPVFSGDAADYTIAPETVQMTARGANTASTTTLTETMTTYAGSFVFVSASWSAA